MKKIGSMLLAGVLCLSFLSGCGETGEDAGNNKQSTTRKNTEALLVAVPDNYISKCKGSISWALNRLKLDIEVEVIGLSGRSGAEGDEADNQKRQLRTELMAGEGPDLILLDANQHLFPDIIKTAQSGAFYDLAPLLDETIAQTDCIQKVMDAGVINGKRYFVPLGFDISGVVARTDWLNGWKPDAKTPVEFITQLSEHAGSAVTVWEQFLTDACPAPLLDTANQTIQLPPQLGDIALYYRENIDLPHMKKFDDGFWESTLSTGLTDAALLAIDGKEVQFLPTPNGQDGYTATVSLAAAVRANSPHAAEAAQIIGQLLQPAQINASTGYTDTQCKYPMIPVGREARELHLKTDMRGNARPDPMLDELLSITGQINAARLVNLADWNATNDFMAFVRDGEAPEDALAAVQEDYRYYFDE